MKPYCIMPNGFTGVTVFLSALKEGKRLLLKAILRLCKAARKRTGIFLILIKVLCDWLEMVLWSAKIPILKAPFEQKTNPFLQ